VVILDTRFNKVDYKFKTLEDFTFDENENICKELEAHRHAEYEMKKSSLPLMSAHGCIKHN